MCHHEYSDYCSCKGIGPTKTNKRQMEFTRLWPATKAQFWQNVRKYFSYASCDRPLSASPPVTPTKAKEKMCKFKLGHIMRTDNMCDLHIAIPRVPWSISRIPQFCFSIGQSASAYPAPRAQYALCPKQSAYALKFHALLPAIELAAPHSWPGSRCTSPRQQN